MSSDWEIMEGQEIEPEGRDARIFRWHYRQAEIEQDVFVQISATAMSSATEALPPPVGAIVATNGRAAVEESLSRGRVPLRIKVDAAGNIWEEPAD